MGIGRQLLHILQRITLASGESYYMATGRGVIFPTWYPSKATLLEYVYLSLVTHWSSGKMRYGNDCTIQRIFGANDVTDMD